MKVEEGSVVIDVPLRKVPSRKSPVFYNPVMKLNRDISVLFLNAVGKKLRCADVLAGSGVRALRLMKECDAEVVANDANPVAVRNMRKNAKLNKLCLKIENMDATRFLLCSEGFDYIDIDPFGSPNPFLDAAVKRVARGGYLGITATDTSALSGSHPKAGLRKYWGLPVRNHCMHEVGVRLLVRKVQLIGAQYSKALIPVFCHSSQHYYRVYFQCSKGKAKVDDIMKCHRFLHFGKDFSQDVSDLRLDVADAGQLWCGSLWNRALVKKMYSSAEGEARGLLNVILDESSVPVVGFFDYYAMCSKLRRNVPDRLEFLGNLRKGGFLASPTHFSYRGVRTDARPKQVLASLLACSV